MNGISIAAICTIVGAVCTIVGTLIGYKTFRKDSEKDTKDEVREDTRCNTRLESKLDYVSKGVDDIRLDIKAQDRKISEIVERVARVEESAKSAHHRIAELVKEE
jgi:predicted RND superfamily exporter protein